MLREERKDQTLTKGGNHSFWKVSLKQKIFFSTPVSNICNGAKQIYKETKKDSKKRTLPISEAAVWKCSVKKEKNIKNS